MPTLIDIALDPVDGKRLAQWLTGLYEVRGEDGQPVVVEIDVKPGSLTLEWEDPELFPDDSVVSVPVDSFCLILSGEFRLPQRGKDLEAWATRNLERWTDLHLRKNELTPPEVAEQHGVWLQDNLTLTDEFETFLREWSEPLVRPLYEGETDRSEYHVRLYRERWVKCRFRT